MKGETLMKRVHVALAMLFAATFIVTGCGGGGGSGGGGGGISITLAPNSATVQPSGSVALTATVTGATNTAVTWSYVGGSLMVLNNTATFTAPSTVGATCTVTARSVADKTKSTSASIVVSNSGGGGGGGTGTTSLHGTVLDSYGSPVDGAQVNWSGGTKAPAYTNFLGEYTLTGVPVGTSITITISKAGLTTKTLNGVVIDPAAGTTASMDIVMTSEAPPAGSKISIHPYNPYDSSQTIEIVLDDPRTFQVEVRNATGTLIYPSISSGWMATVIVTGAADGTVLADDPTLFQVTGTQLGATAKITVLLARADGTLASTTVATTVTDVVTPPPPPGGTPGQPF